MFEPGTYRGQLKEAVTTEAKTGTLQLALKFDVGERWNGVSWEGVATPAERVVFVPLTDKAMPYSEAKLEKLGFNGNFETPEFQLDAAGVDLICREDSYNGKATEKWDLAGFGLELEQAATDKLKRLNARWRALSPSTPAKAPAPPPTTPTPTPPPAPPIPAEPVRTATRDEAWATLCKSWEGRPQSDLETKWDEAIATRRKPEEQFAAEDWGEVAAQCEVRF